MGVLSDIIIADKPRRTPPQIEWDSLERTLFRLTTADVRQFAKKHPKETFYGFAFDCNGAFDALRRTRNFSTLAMDHDESESTARARMRRIRRSEGGA